MNFQIWQFESPSNIPVVTCWAVRPCMWIIQTQQTVSGILDCQCDRIHELLIKLEIKSPLRWIETFLIPILGYNFIRPKTKLELQFTSFPLIEKNCRMSNHICFCKFLVFEKLFNGFVYHCVSDVHFFGSRFFQVHWLCKYCIIESLHLFP